MSSIPKLVPHLAPPSPGLAGVTRGLRVPASGQEARALCLKKLPFTDCWALFGGRGQGQQRAGPRPENHSPHS